MSPRYRQPQLGPSSGLRGRLTVSIQPLANQCGDSEHPVARRHLRHCPLSLPPSEGRNSAKATGSTWPSLCTIPGTQPRLVNRVAGVRTTSVMLSQGSVTVFQLKTVTPKTDAAALGRFVNRTVKYSVSDTPPINTPKAASTMVSWVAE